MYKTNITKEHYPNMKSAVLFGFIGISSSAICLLICSIAIHASILSAEAGDILAEASIGIGAAMTGIIIGKKGKGKQAQTTLIADSVIAFSLFLSSIAVDNSHLLNVKTFIHLALIIVASFIGCIMSTKSPRKRRH